MVSRFQIAAVVGIAGALTLSGCGGFDDSLSGSTNRTPADWALTFGGAGPVVAGMSEADLLAQGITVAGEPVDGCLRYSIGNYGATVEIFTIDGKIVGANSTSASSGITSASSEQDIRIAYPEATFTSTSNFRSPRNTDLLVSDPNHPDRYLAFSIGADGFNHYEIWSGTKEFVTEPFLMCTNAGNSVAAATSSAVSTTSTPTSTGAITFGGYGEVVTGTVESELVSHGIDETNMRTVGGDCTVYYDGTTAAINVKNDAVVGAVGSRAIHGVGTGSTPAQVRNAFSDDVVEQVNDLGPVLVVSQPSKPTMYLGFQFENAKIGALSDSDTVTQVRGGTKKFVTTPLGGC